MAPAFKSQLPGGIYMKKITALLCISLLYSIIFMGCQKANSPKETTNIATPVETLSPTSEPTMITEDTNNSSNINWKCIYMGTLVMATATPIENQIKFANEKEWLEFANDNLPNSIVDVVAQEINWDTQGVMVLQGISAKGYFSFMPQIANINIVNGLLDVVYEDNVDTTKTFYVRSEDYSNTIKTIYMILLDKSEIEQIH